MGIFIRQPDYQAEVRETGDRSNVRVEKGRENEHYTLLLDQGVAFQTGYTD